MPTPSLVLNSVASAYARSALSSPPKRGGPLPAQQSFARALKADRGQLRGGPTAKPQPTQPLEAPLDAAAETSTEGWLPSDQPAAARPPALTSNAQLSRAADGPAQTAASIAQGLPNGSSAAVPAGSLSVNFVVAPTIEEVGQTADPTFGWEDNRNDGEARGRTGQDSTGWLAIRDDAAPPRTAAIGRAMQVQAGVHLENVTGLASSQALVDGDRFTAGVMRGLSVMLNQRGGVMTMRLRPPQLGDLRVQMTISRGVVTAQFHAATPQAQALLEQSLAMLRSALEANGLTVERLTVHLIQTTNAQATRQEAADEQSQSSRHHSDAGEGRSRDRRDGDVEQFRDHFVSQSDQEAEAFDLPASRQPAAGVDSRHDGGIRALTLQRQCRPRQGW